MKALLFTTFLTASTSFASQDHLVLIGGGPNPVNSQFSIESNVVWFQQLAEESGFSSTNTLFGSGGEHPHEIKYVDPTSVRMGALSIIYDNRQTERFQYRASILSSETTLPATQSNVSTFLKARMSSLQEEDSLFLIYSGHGGRTSSAENNYLHLWNNTQLSIEGLHTLLHGKPEDAKVRFVLPQCFSGRFTTLSYQNLADESGISGNVCGFTSVSQWDYSEGCTASVNTSDYRDYASLLVQSATGKNRQGETSPRAWDLNNDQQISLYEAHLHTIATSDSADMPRSTSEEYLLDSQHWLSKWQSSQFKIANNDYTAIAKRMTVDFENEFGSRAFQQELNSKLETARKLLENRTKTEYDNMDERVILQRKLRSNLLVEWPQLSDEMTSLYHSTIANHLDDINAWIESQADYKTLLELEAKADVLSQEWIDANRALAKLKRIHRLLKLSRLHEETLSAGGERLEAYLALQQCEQWVPPFE